MDQDVSHFYFLRVGSVSFKTRGESCIISVSLRGGGCILL